MNLLQRRLDRVIARLIDIRNEVTEHFDTDYTVEEPLGKVEEAVESLAQEIEEQ